MVFLGRAKKIIVYQITPCEVSLKNKNKTHCEVPHLILLAKKNIEFQRKLI